MPNCARDEVRLLLVHHADAGDIAAPSLHGAARVGDVLVLPLAPDEVPQVRRPALSARLLDRHHYSYRPDRPERRRACEQALFDAIADRYDAEVDEATNRRVIDGLLQTVAAHAPARRPLRVLDFGCGTGLAVTVADPSGFCLVGTDTSPRMLARAASRGMRTVPPQGLHGLGKGWADGTIASFVLHLAVPAADVAAAAQALGSGGILAANFHKGHGRTAAAAALEACGLVPLHVAEPDVVAWQRP